MVWKHLKVFSERLLFCFFSGLLVEVIQSTSSTICRFSVHLSLGRRFELDQLDQLVLVILGDVSPLKASSVRKTAFSVTSPPDEGYRSTGIHLLAEQPSDRRVSKCEIVSLKTSYPESEHVHWPDFRRRTPDPPLPPPG